MARRLIPTPLHGWRAFWGEVGIIVLGVLIALGAQQLAEYYAERERAHNADVAVRAELRKLSWFAAESVVVAPCVLAQLDVIQQRLVSGEAAPLPSYGEAAFRDRYVVRIPSRPWQDLAWQSVSANDGVRLFDDQLAQQLTSFYAQVRQQQGRSNAANQLSSQLNSLSVMMPRTDDARLRYLDAIQRLRSEIGNTALVGTQLRNNLAAMNLGTSDADARRELRESGTIAFCQTHQFPLDPLTPGDAEQAE